MKGRFEIRSIKSQWKPPFKKEITDEIFEVEISEAFDRILGNGNDETVYQLISADTNVAKVKYSKLFTLKTHNPGTYELTLIKDTPVEMTYLWGEDGITKKITFKGITASETTNETENTNETNQEKDSQ